MAMAKPRSVKDETRTLIAHLNALPIEKIGKKNRDYEVPMMTEKAH